MKSYQRFRLDQGQPSLQNEVRDAAAKRVYELYMVPGELYVPWEKLDTFDQNRFRAEAEGFVRTAAALRNAGTGEPF